LVTQVTGRTQPMNKRTLRRALWGYPLVTMKATALIHWQAIKLLSRGIKFHKKPEQLDRDITGSKKP